MKNYLHSIALLGLHAVCHKITWSTFIFLYFVTIYKYIRISLGFHVTNQHKEVDICEVKLQVFSFF